MARLEHRSLPSCKTLLAWDCSVEENGGRAWSVSGV